MRSWEHFDKVNDNCFGAFLLNEDGASNGTVKIANS
jgi:hypothetical protein